MPLDNEGEIVKRFSSQFPNLKTELFDFNNCNPLEGLNMFWRCNAYNPIINKNDFWIRGILDYASKKDIKWIFNAQCGNYTISQTGSEVYIDMLLNLNLFSLLIKLIHQCKGINFFKLVKVQLIIPLIIFYNSAKARARLSQFKNDDIDKITIWDILKEFKLHQSIKFDKSLNEFEFTGNMWAIYANEFAVEVLDPTTDLRLVRFLRSIPTELYFNKLIRKYLYKISFKNLLPDYLLNNSKRMIQAHDFSIRVSKIEKTYIENILNSIVRQKCFADDKMIMNFFDQIVKNPDKNRQSDAVVKFLKLISLRNFCNFHFK